MVIISRKGSMQQLAVLDDRVKEQFFLWFNGKVAQHLRVKFDTKGMPYFVGKKTEGAFVPKQLQVRTF